MLLSRCISSALYFMAAHMSDTFSRTLILRECKSFMSIVTGLLIFFAAASHANQNCTYSISKESMEIGWTAFKTTQKVPVQGTFKVYNVEGKLKADSLKKLLDGLSGSVQLKSNDSKSPERDLTLSKFFFNLIKTTPVTGTLQNFSDKDMKGQLNLRFNGHQEVLPLTYTLNETTGELSAVATLDLLGFKATSAFDSIHKACEKLHMGSDGVSKTWTDVQVNLKAKLEKICKP